MVDFVALPHGCSHLDWQWANPTGQPDHPVDGDQREPLLTQFATWTAHPDGGSPDRQTRVTELHRQGLSSVGEPHLCQTRDDGWQLWVVEVAPAGQN